MEGHARRFDLWPLGMLGMIALVVAIETLVARYEIDFLAPWHWDWRHNGHAASTLATQVEILCIGDSVLKFGVLPPVVENLTGRSAYNLAVAQGQAPASYFLLRRALANGARPSAVVLETTPHLLCKDPTQEPFLRHWPEMLALSESVDLAWSARSPDLLGALLVTSLFPSARMRQEIRAHIPEALRGVPAQRRYTVVKFWRNMRVNRGALVMPALPGSHASSDVAFFRDFLARWDPLPLNVHYLDRLLALASSRGIPVFWLLAPVADEVGAMCEQSGYSAGFSAFVERMRTRHPGIVVLDARRSGYRRDLFTTDPIHLHRAGAEVLSADVAEALSLFLDGATIPPGDRWVHLPRHGSREIGVELEDMLASEVVIRERAGGGSLPDERRSR